mmetsp:Transcript_41187/g.129379  ORF Transcript_41187/g.129379 Transcript_41187/m.129379 type:complete len:121 (-) Transcript_41187:102-464(-)
MTCKGVVNCSYAGFLITRKQNWAEFVRPDERLLISWRNSILSGIAFSCHIHLYGAAAKLLGTLGPVIAWPVLMCCTMTFGQLWGFFLREFRPDDDGRRINALGTAVLCMAIVMTSSAAAV